MLSIQKKARGLERWQRPKPTLQNEKKPSEDSKTTIKRNLILKWEVVGGGFVSGPHIAQASLEHTVN